MIESNFYLLTGYLNNSLLTSNSYELHVKLANPKLFIKEIFYFFEYAAISQNEYYNHLAFSYIEELILSVNKAKVERSNWNLVLISLFLTKFNQLGYFNLAIPKIYEKADEICILIANNKLLKQEQLVLILIYLEQRVRENKSLLPVLKKMKKKLSKEKLFDHAFLYDEWLRNATLLKLLSFESNETAYEDSIDFGLKLLGDKFEDEERHGIVFRKMLFLFEDELKFVSDKFLIDFIDKNRKSIKECFLFSEAIMNKNLGREFKNPADEKKVSLTMEKDLNTIDFSSKLDLGFDILMAAQENTSGKRAYYSFLN
ncbi:hypothetical protein [Pedobacter soli]|uniref:Uncharacterized protein n=1 Tax=Pedobacter soli TaxID=390242 RepID=A0A1G6VPH5_9SPHI|nr:hypothetical protein [Pedobacter soli]SDD55323.1 hypothetical protein SAMN04488024_106206 [Pedobacter soli]